ncbi:hypothetical protein SacxiDRAFT_0428 [Saccharomonospora xinjiangensis XJ-54]|uniref:Uncharacterized protein n=1 Tax=Saccharomonospora xinjiangensis XJ-54 TaxID=882086 RepID=I0UXV2_9PSEU|nr:hypothetical protein SacxiDRAFT_0428 [Saccharomonospora xinjiangensis XJ-54]
MVSSSPGAVLSFFATTTVVSHGSARAGAGSRAGRSGGTARETTSPSKIEKSGLPDSATGNPRA